MKAARLPLLVLAALAWASPSIGGADEVVARCRLSECIAQALETHPLLQASTARVAGARALVTERKAERGPQMGVVGGLGYVAGEPITPFGAFRPGDNRRRLNGGFYDAQIRLTVPVLSEGRLVGAPSHSQREAELLASEEELARQAARREVAEAVAQAYFEMVGLQHAAPLYEAVVTARELAAQEARVRAGEQLVSRDDALLAEVELATARRDLRMAYLSLEAAGARLARSMGFASGRAEALPGTVEEPLRPGPAAADPESFPRFRARLRRLEAKGEEIVRLGKERLPRAELLARFGVADDFDPPVSDQFYVGLRVTIPLLDSGLAERKAARAAAERDEQKADLDYLRLALTSRIEEIEARVHILDADIAVLEEQIAQARSVVETKQALESESLATPSEAADARVALLRLELERDRSTQERALLGAKLWIAAGEWDLPAAGDPSGGAAPAASPNQTPP